MADIDESVVYDRDYTDAYRIKDITANTIMPTYFPDSTGLTIGLEGMISESISTVTEDTFNAISSLLPEAFPSRAKFASSIYSHAAPFQLSDVFADAATCDFMILLVEDDIKKNFVTESNSKFNYFYIDKGTLVFVDEIPFSLEYDIVIKAKYLGKDTTGNDKYVYSASYDIDDYKNSISNTTSPYIKVIVSKNGYIGITVSMRQYVRSTLYESITDNSTINYPTFNISYDDQIAGIDVLYKGPNDSGYNTQLELRPIYSVPTTKPFCYYKKSDDNTIQLSFNTKDGYFQPKFNSELKVIVYGTTGVNGNFPQYTGDNITITKNQEVYQYDYPWTIVAKPQTGSTNGADSLTKDALRDLTIEKMATANALTTEHDLDLYFKNFKYRNNVDCKFIKKRNDAVETLFSAYLYIVNSNNYFYPTNTLTLDSNIMTFECKNETMYYMKPGYIFGYKMTEIYYTPIKYYDAYNAKNYYQKNYNDEVKFYEDGVESFTVSSISPDDLAKMVKLGDVIVGSQYYYKLTNDVYKLYDTSGNLVVGSEASTVSEEELLRLFLYNKVKFGTIEGTEKVVDFIIDIDKEIIHKKNYLNYYDTYIQEKNNPKMTLTEYMFNYTYAQYKYDNQIDTKISLFDDYANYIKGKEFVFTNPFLMAVNKVNGLISYYQTYINQDISIDSLKLNENDAFVQFITYTMHLKRDMDNSKKYTLSLSVLPSVSIDVDQKLVVDNLVFDETSITNDTVNNKVNQFITPKTGYTVAPSLQNYNKELLKQNNLRILISFFKKDSNISCGYIEMIPTAVDSSTGQVTFSSVIETDDYITNDGNFRIVHRCPHCGHIITNSANNMSDDRSYYCPTCSSNFSEGIINTQQSDDIFLPIDNANIEVSILFKDNSDAPDYPTDNSFYQYDTDYTGYRWTNVYSTQTDYLTFVEPLTFVRSVLEYKDYYKSGVEAFDLNIYDIPFFKYSLLAYKDTKMTVTDNSLVDDVGKFYDFMNSYQRAYAFLSGAKTTLKNCTNIDVKFYNTYGKSTNFVVGDNDEYLDTNNLSVKFDIWVTSGTDTVAAETELKNYIKSVIESINSSGTNELYISNLIRNIENKYAYVHHTKFKGINEYDTTYQSIKNTKIDLNSLTKDERRHYVPEILVVNTSNIILTIQEAT